MKIDAQTRKRRPITITRVVAPEPIPAEDLAAAERMLARLVARAYAADHPELFGKHTDSSEDHSGPPAAAAAVVGGLPASAGAPERETSDHDDNVSNGDRW